MKKKKRLGKSHWMANIWLIINLSQYTDLYLKSYAFPIIGLIIRIDQLTKMTLN